MEECLPMAEVLLPEIFVRNKRYPLSLFYDLSIFYLQQRQGDPGIALSFYHTPGNKSDDNSGECICHRFGCVILFKDNTPTRFFDQFRVMVFPDDRFLVLVTKDDL